MTIKVGTVVEFHPKVYRPPYTPWYDEYDGHLFEVVACYTEEPYGDEAEPHYKLKCIDDPSVKLKGNVHEDELVILKETNNV